MVLAASGGHTFLFSPYSQHNVQSDLLLCRDICHSCRSAGTKYTSQETNTEFMRRAAPKTSPYITIIHTNTSHCVLLLNLNLTDIIQFDVSIMASNLIKFIYCIQHILKQLLMAKVLHAIQTEKDYNKHTTPQKQKQIKTIIMFF